MFRKGPGQKVLETIEDHGGSISRVALQAKHGDIVKRVLAHMKADGLVKSSINSLEWSLTRKGRSLLGPQGVVSPEFCEACECTPCDCNWGN